MLAKRMTQLQKGTNSLLASGLSSSTVGTMASQVIMQGFVGFTIPIWVRRLVTMFPAVLVVLLGFNPTQSLVITPVMFSRRRDLMGTLVNKSITTWDSPFEHHQGGDRQCLSIRTKCRARTCGSRQ